MKHFLALIFIVIATYCSGQKYVLLDKNMSLPVTYTNAMSARDNFKGYFPVEKSKIHEFIIEIEKLNKLLNAPKASKSGSFDRSIGTTTIHGLRVPLSAEERIDIVLTTDYEDGRATMHLCDAKLSNANNAFFLNTWLKYLHSYID